MRNHGFLRVGAASPKLKVSDTTYNVAEIVKLIDSAKENGCSVVVFPELCITGYTCGDLFLHSLLLKSALDGLKVILEASRDSDILIVVGLPLQVGLSLYNCAAIILNGKILGVVPKTHVPDYNGFSDQPASNSLHFHD
jgi:NAD+ synthase (glutamine-hydrolysing)